MPERHWSAERFSQDAPVWLEAAEASAWADGYNAAVREAIEAMDDAVTLHIWRYSKDEPPEREPWIVTIVVDGEAIENPPCFRTFEAACDFVQSGNWREWATQERTRRSR